jgi:hypothetical protein
MPRTIIVPIIAYSPNAVHARPSTGGIFAITPAAQFALRPMGRLQRITSAEPLDQSSEFHQVRHPEERSPLTHDDLRVLGNKVRPLRGNRANGLIINLQQKPPAIAVVPFTQAGELLSAEGMERMSYPHKARRCEGSICILDRVTSGSRRAGSRGGPRASQRPLNLWRPTNWRCCSRRAIRPWPRGLRLGVGWTGAAGINSGPAFGK